METFSDLLVLWAGNSPTTSQFPAQRPMTRGFDVFYHLRLNKRLSKQSWGWWFQTSLRPWWRHCNVVDMNTKVTHTMILGLYWRETGRDGKLQRKIPHLYARKKLITIHKTFMNYFGGVKRVWILTHWGRDKMAAFSQTTFSLGLNELKEFEILIDTVMWVCSGNDPDSKVHGANMGPTWVLSVPDGPHDSPMNLAIRGLTKFTNGDNWDE